MKLLFDERSVQSFNRIALPFVVALSVSSLLLFYLPATSVQHPKMEMDPFYDRYRIGSLLSIVSNVNENKAGMTPVQREVLTPVPHRLNAIYKDGSRAFIAVDDGKTTTFVDYGTKYKNLYRLIRISSNGAVFSAYGKAMPLWLGEEGNLSLKEMVTEYVSNRTEAAVSQNYVIPRTTFERYNQNLSETFKTVKISEVSEGGKTTGFHVDAIRQGTPLALLGLQQGDIITGVDNKPLDSYAAAIAAYRSVLNRTAIKITVIRSNQPKDLEYEISR
ncbi:MAG: hypothetical protein PHW64_03945 [Sulfuricurvum sp.]|nr:hypothetical protein [Sulfuricurvum sp.]